MKHTPAPWTFGGRNSMEVYAPSGSALLKMTYHSMWPVEWQIANAQFVVRACNAHEDMLDLLEAAVARIELANQEGNPILSAWLPGARAAIARAKGE